MAMHFINEAACAAKTTLSRSTRWRLIQAGKFPDKVEVTPGGRKAWLESEIDNWMAERVAASRGQKGGA